MERSTRAITMGNNRNQSAFDLRLLRGGYPLALDRGSCQSRRDVSFDSGIAG